MKTIIIKRHKWSRGNLYNNALLIGRNVIEVAFLTKNTSPLKKRIPKLGTMCCLGFACLALGATRKEIKNRALPKFVERLLPGLNRQDDEDWCAEAATINDDEKITDEEREEKLVSLAAENGFKFVFKS